MWLRCHADFLACLGVCCGCAIDVPGGPGAEAEPAAIFTPQSDDGVVGPVFVAESAISEEPLPRLFSGVLSDYHRGRADDDDLVGTLRERQLPLFVEFRDDRQFASPLSWLEPGEYSLIVAPGQIASFSVGGGGRALRRIWPGAKRTEDSEDPTDSASSGGSALYCLASEGSDELASEGSDELPALGDAELRDGTPAEWLAVPGSSQCALLSARAPLSRAGVLSPMQRGGLPIEPTLFTVSETRPPVDVASVFSCRSDESRLAVGCARVEDDRMTIRSAAGQSLWMFDGQLQATLPSYGAEPAVLLGLTPGMELRPSLRVIDEFGTLYSASPTIVTATQQPHVVISEVMANPLGPEPAQEWIELYNDGSNSVQLEGWQLSDGGASVGLPQYEMQPGAHVLLVSQAYDENDPADVPPIPGTKLLRLSQLGKSGLSNAGERLTLRSPDGQLRSSFPETPKPAAGVSVARRAPHSPDAATESFALHDGAGASPGARNSTR